MSSNSLVTEIVNQKEKLVQAAVDHNWNFTHYEVLKISQQLDELIVQAMREQKSLNNSIR